MPMRISGINSGLDTDAIVQELVSAYSKKTEKYEKEQTKLGWKQEIWKNLNTKVNSFYKSLDSMRFSSAYSTRKTTSSDTTKATVSASGSTVTGTQKLHILSTAQSGYVTGGKLSLREGAQGKLTADTKMRDLGFTGTNSVLKLKMKDENGDDVTKEIKVSKDSSISSVVSQLNEAGVNANFDEGNGRIFLSSKETGKAADFTLTAEDADAKEALGVLGLDTSDNAYGNKAAKIDASDATIVLNGTLYTNSSNNFTINGLNIAVSGVTDDINDYMGADGKLDISALNDKTAVTLTTAVDSQGIYDKVKEFLTNYNNIINEFTKLYNADSAKDYNPLTDEEKDAMSDTEIEKWETKIKDSLLRRDNTLGTLMSTMTTTMSKGININGKDYSLSSFGIHTLGFLNAAKNEQYAFHIDGDQEDENTSNNEEKLMAAITSDPDAVVEFMKQLSSNLYSALDKQMTSTSMRSRFSIYNDKELDKQYKNYTKTISEWEDKVAEKEDYYYKKFSEMETALAKLQSQQSSMSGLFGN